MEDHSGTDILTAICGVPHTGADGYVLKEAAAMESPHKNRLLAGDTAHGEPML